MNRDDVNTTITASGTSAVFETYENACLSATYTTANSSGTNKTLQIELETSDDAINFKHMHSSLRFTGDSFQKLSGARVTSRYYRFRYIVSGTNPSFDVVIYTTLKDYLPTKTSSMIRYTDLSLATTNNTSTVFESESNDNISLMLVRSAGGNLASIAVQVSNDNIVWSNLTNSINLLASATVSQSFSGESWRLYRVIVTSAAAEATADIFWNSTGGS